MAGRKFYLGLSRLFGRLYSFSVGAPPPVRVGFTEDAGRGVFATREIRTGDLIHTADPLVAHPSLAALDKVCYYCLRRFNERFPSLQWENGKIPANTLQYCENEVHFCSSECTEKAKAFYDIEQKTDWSVYHEQCRNKDLKYPLLIKRLACMVVSGMASANILDILEPANFAHSMSSGWEEEFELLLRAFRNAGTPDRLNFLTEEWYFRALCRIRVNVFRIEIIGEYGYHTDLLSAASASITSEMAVGNAVYMLPSMYNHDCDPNTHIVWVENTKARVKTLRNIEAGEELRISYIDASMGREARQSLLYQGFGFMCQCLRCKSES